MLVNLCVTLYKQRPCYYSHLLSTGPLLQERQSSKCPQAQPGIIHQESGRGCLSAAGQFHLSSLEALGLGSTHLSDLLLLRDNPGLTE